MPRSPLLYFTLNVNFDITSQYFVSSCVCVGSVVYVSYWGSRLNVHVSILSVCAAYSVIFVLQVSLMRAYVHYLARVMLRRVSISYLYAKYAFVYTLFQEVNILKSSNLQKLLTHGRCISTTRLCTALVTRPFSWTMFEYSPMGWGLFKQ